MNRKLVFAAMVLVGVGGAMTSFAAPKAPPPPPVAAEPASVGSLAPLLEGFKWGSNHAEIIKIHNQVGGVFDKDYDPILAKLQPGARMQATEAERDSKKSAFAASWIEFKDTPTGFDRTAIKDEYTYRNKEAVMYVDRAGRRRYFFFINDRLWKIYDEVALPAPAGPPSSALGGAKTFVEAVTKLAADLGAPGRILAADPEKGRPHTVIDWQDASTHLRVVDRTGEPLPVVGLVLEDRATLGNIATLRANKSDDPLAMDPAIAQATRGEGRVDPNAPRDAGAPPPKNNPKNKK
jgi:hypothetical protein